MRVRRGHTHDRSRTEQCGEGTTDSTADAVQGKDVEGFVDPEDKLESGGEVTSDGGDGADGDGRGHTDVSRCGGDTDQATTSTRSATSFTRRQRHRHTHAMAPEQNPTALNLRSSLQSINIQVIPPTEADI